MPSLVSPSANTPLPQQCLQRWDRDSSTWNGNLTASHFWHSRVEEAQDLNPPPRAKSLTIEFLEQHRSTTIRTPKELLGLQLEWEIMAWLTPALYHLMNL